MDILLAETLETEALTWLQSRHKVEVRPELASAPEVLLDWMGRAKGVVLPRQLAVTRDVVAACPHLKVIARMHAGTDNTDLEACAVRDIKVVQAATAYVRANAEYLLASLMLLFRQGLAEALQGQHLTHPVLGREIQGSTIGILGLAPSAHTLAQMLTALGARVIGYDPAVHYTAPVWAALRVQPVSLPELLASADAVSVQMLYASRYRGLLGESVLASCRSGQLWVSVSRSSLFDEQALADALADGRIETCLIDAPDAGFAAPGTPLHELPNLHLTPRMGSFTREAKLRASWYVARRVSEVLTGPPTASAIVAMDPLVSSPMPLHDPSI